MALWKGLVLSTFMMASASQAFAVSVCDKRETILDRLGARYQETPHAVGITNNGGLVEVLTSTGGETWTIIVSMPHGLSCLVASGEWWKEKPREVPDERS